MAKPRPMKTYLVLYHMNATARRKAERMRKEGGKQAVEETMKAWGAGAEKCGDQLLEMGAPLAKGTKLDNSGFADSKRGVSGYSILAAKSIGGARKLCRKHPHLSWVDKGCEIEIHELQPM